MTFGGHHVLQPIEVVRTAPTDHVVLLDERGRPRGSADKSTVHGQDTPLHLALSCYVVRADGQVLVTRRAPAKRTWPGVWTNACCGHPRPDEAMGDAVQRHLRDELGLRPLRLRVALPDFAYRATMDNGLVEHELCPVHVAECDSDPFLDPDEADAYEWMPWAQLVDRASLHPTTLSPWSVTQIRRLSLLSDDLLQWVRDAPAAGEPSARNGRSVSLDRVTRDVEQVLDDFLQQRQEELARLDPLADELCAPIRALFEAGGKRLRPYFVHLGHQAVNGEGDGTGNSDDVVHLAASVEMLHMFALLHDDVMDRSPLRRGAPTAHVRLADLHRQTRSVGDPQSFGTSAAIVAGDLAFVWADQLLDRLNCSGAVEREVRKGFDALRHEVILGQYLDLRLTGPCATDEQAHTVALLKSGRYTVTRPLELGASLAGGTCRQTQVLRRYGDSAGVAFQLRDDVLGVFGDPAITGKGTSEDIRSGKASLLLVRAMELASPSQRDVLVAGLGDEALGEDDVDRCRQAVRDTGALASIEILIDAKLDEARAAVAALPAAPRDELLRLADLIGRRCS